MLLLPLILVDAAAVTVCRPVKAFIFYSGHPDVCTAIIIIMNLNGHKNSNKNVKNLVPSVSSIGHIELTIFERQSR